MMSVMNRINLMVGWASTVTGFLLDIRFQFYFFARLGQQTNKDTKSGMSILVVIVDEINYKIRH
jgi:hypothetical protein